jgi:16S rRNA (guanine527-N7)-methyltransferase
MRAENVKGDFDFIVSRAVTTCRILFSWKPKSKEQQTRIENGILYLKGDLTEELKVFKSYWIQFSWFFEDEFLRLKSGALAVEVWFSLKVESHKV